jgi:magnesium-transporting ATPase (P-type)
MLTWGVDAELDAMAQKTPRQIRWYDLVIWIAIAGIGWAALFSVAWVVYEAVR